jgi:hypothetical protein
MVGPLSSYTRMTVKLEYLPWIVDSFGGSRKKGALATYFGRFPSRGLSLFRGDELGHRLS